MRRLWTPAVLFVLATLALIPPPFAPTSRAHARSTPRMPAAAASPSTTTTPTTSATTSPADTAGPTHEIRTNAVVIAEAPGWLREPRVERVVERIQSALEWDIRQVRVDWYRDQARFESVHGFGPAVLAFSRPSDNSVHVGPRIGDVDFDSVFGHELVHVILYQKYKGAVPKWIEEGLANFLAKRGRVDYAWLAAQPPIGDVHDLVHPFKGFSSGSDHFQYHYQASQALAEMLAAKCGGMDDLLRLSVGKKMESYISTLCGIDDVNSAFRKWVAAKAPRK